MEQIDIFVASLTSFWTELASFIPQLLGAIIALVLGWMLAKVARRGVMRVLTLLKFDRATEKSGLEAFMKHAELDISVASVIGNLVYWLIILVMIVTVANSLGLQMVADLFNKVVLYIPNVIVAILVLVFGTILARFINRLVFAWLNNMEFDGALTVSTFSDLASHAVFETGSVAHDEFEVAVPADDAELLGLRVGDELIISDLPFTVSGTWRAVDSLDPRWYGDARVASGGGDPLGPFVIDESAWARIGSVPLAIWTIVPESIDSITATNLTAVTSAWAGVMQSWRGTVPEYESMDV